MTEEQLLQKVIEDINKIRKEEFNAKPISYLKMGDKSCRDCPILRSIFSGIRFYSASLQGNGTIFYSLNYAYRTDEKVISYIPSFAEFIRLYDKGIQFQEYHRKAAPTLIIIIEVK